MCTGGRYKYGIFKYSYARMEKASTENSSTGKQGWKMQVRKNRVRNNNAVTGNTTEITLPNNVRPWNRPRCDRLIGVTKVGLPAFSYAPVVRSRFFGFMLFDFNYGIYANETLVAVNGHCPICRGPIDTTVQFYN